MNRRNALVTLAGLVGVAAGSLLLCKPADARRPYAHPYPDSHYGSYSVALEQPGGGGYPAFSQGGSVYVAGELGQQYVVRVSNHSPRRVEAVVTVDGRDTITGALGDYRRHRGYVIEPYGSITVDGFRQSLDHVAAFRFTALSDSYSARRGSPHHVGVVGVAVYEEYEYRPPPPRRYSRPVQPSRPYYDPYAGADAEEAAKRSDGRARGNRPAAESAPDDAYGYGGRWSPPPHPERLGTEYGETQWSSVREVEFRRKNKRRPDALLTVYYDSLDGLRARGIQVDPYLYDPYPDPYPYAPDPFPERGFAPPPPRRY